MAKVAGHLSLAELQAGYRTSGDARLARHYQVIWLLAQGRSCAEVAQLASLARGGVGKGAGGAAAGALRGARPAGALGGALRRAAAGPLQRLWAVVVGRPTAGQRRAADDPDA